jgi:hypothetical protein
MTNIAGYGSGSDPRIRTRIRTKMSRIRNTATNNELRNFENTTDSDKKQNLLAEWQSSDPVSYHRQLLPT